MRRHLAYVLSGLVGAVAMLALILGLEMQVATAHTGAELPGINRALKGDRLPVPLKPVNVRIPSPPSSEAPNRLPDGCEGLVSAITKSPLARTPARCIS